MQKRVLLSGDECDVLLRLGRTLRLARLRRNLSQVDLAERMGVARASVATLENGHPGVGVGMLLKALTVMGYTERLGELLASDPIGDDADIALGRQRSSRRLDVAPF